MWTVIRCTCTSYWENSNSFLRKYIVPAAKRVGADMLEFAAAKNAEVVCGRKSFKTAAKSVGRQTLKKQLGSGSRKRTGAIIVRQASRVFLRKSAKQMSRWRRDIFSNLSHKSCHEIFGTIFFWQFLEILEGKSQYLTISCHPMNKTAILLLLSSKTAQSLSFKRIGTITLIWDRGT